jgi:MSHA biogenesis protein MshQ
MNNKKYEFQFSWLLLRLLFFSLLTVPLVGLAASYNMTSSKPSCSGVWSNNGNTYTCTGVMTLSVGDVISTSSSVTVISNGGIVLNGSNTIGTSSRSVNLQTTSGDINVTGTSTIYGNVSSTSGNVTLANASVNGYVTTGGKVSLSGGAVTSYVTGNNGITMVNGATISGNMSSTNGAINLSGGSVGGSVTGANGVTTTSGTNITGNVSASNGKISLSGGNVGGSVSSNCCTVTTNSTNISNGVSSGNDSISINGGTIAGTISSGGGNLSTIQNVTMTSGSITMSNTVLAISNSTIGSAVNQVIVSSNNNISISSSSVIFGNVTAANWPNALTIDQSSTIHGVCASDTNSTLSPGTYNNRCDGGCYAPSNAPAVALTCVCDNFGRTSLNPSTIFGSNWIVSSSGTTVFNPTISQQGYLRLTQNTGNNATAATVPGLFPASGNYISVEFKHYAYNGSGADGIAVTLSDYATTVVPGAFGGSLGYAQKGYGVSDCTTSSGCPGFAGGWIGIALDEYGNYENNTEGRINGYGTNVYSQSVGVRGPGAGMNGYRWIGGNIGVGNIDNNGSSSPSPGYTYQVIVDARNVAAGSIPIYVNRDTTSGGQNYVNLFSGNAYSEANNAVKNNWLSKLVPDYWKISFTGSTGGANNIHEISGLKICAQTVYPPNSAGSTANGFSAIDESYIFPASTTQWQSYQTGHIFTKLVGVPFKLNIAALSSNGIQTGYVISGTKNVTVRLVDNSDTSSANICVLGSSSPSSGCLSKATIASQTLSFSSSDAGQKQTTSFNLSSAYRNLAVIVDDGTTRAVAVDGFSVRPQNITVSLTSGSPVKAGLNFVLTATTPVNQKGYSGTLTITTSGNSAGNPAINPVSALDTQGNPSTVVGVFTPSPLLFSAATDSGSQSTATLTASYSEAGSFILPAGSVYDGVFSTDQCPSVPTSAACKNTWVSVDAITGDCVVGSYSNTAVSGKYGCNIANTTDTTISKFIPDHFETTITAPMGCGSLVFSTPCPTINPTSNLVYSGQPFSTTIAAYTVAVNGAESITKNYVGYSGSTYVLALEAWDAPGSITTQNPSGSSIALSVPQLTGGAVFVLGVASNISTTYTFQNSPTKPTNIYIRAKEASGGDLVSSLQSPASASVEGGVKVISGRMHLLNAYGSEQLPIRVPVRIEYWSDQSQWLLNTSDSSSSISAANVAIGNCQGSLAGQCTGGTSGVGGQPSTTYPVTTRFVTQGVQTPASTVNVYGGAATMILSRLSSCPSASATTCPSGTLDVAVNLGASPSPSDASCNTTHPNTTAGNESWLRFAWCSAGQDPNARITFGSPKSSYIYMRERY